ncbi:MAG TPA: cysteine desulfurase family protein [Acidimicrobiia bacterium]|nr:cysteine desulfurase family protein [Acidimicrobiia bacterium]
MSRAYLDHASSSPLRPASLAAVLPFLSDHVGDPGRLHAEGRVTRVAIETAREQVAALFGARPREVVFTASGTEAINTAVYGALTRAAEQGRHDVVTSAVDHSAVLDACRRDAGEHVTTIGVDHYGRFDPREVIDAITDTTALVSVQLANHEVGTIQSVADVVGAARQRAVAVHVDACAAAGHVAIDFAALGADLCSLTGHKWGAPKGAAALLVRRGMRFPAFVLGGSQERARRGGIEDVAAIVGFGAAAEEVGADGALAREAAAARHLTARLATGATTVAGVERYGDPDACLPHLVCLGVAGVEAEPILLALDQHGVAVHSGSSCSSETLEPSPVLAAMGVDADRSLRVSTGWSSTDADVDAFLDVFPGIVERLRGLRTT